MTYDEIVSAITLHIRRNCSCMDFRSFFVGCAEDEHKDIKEFHHVSEKDNFLKICKADSIVDAIRIKKHFMLLGMSGDIDHKANGINVYCYKIGMNTVENE